MASKAASLHQQARLQNSFQRSGWTLWTTIHSLGTSVAFKLFKSQAEFTKLCTAVPHVCPKTQMSHKFHRAVSFPNPSPAPAYPASQHTGPLVLTGLLDNASLAMDKGLGLCEDHHLLYHKEE